MKWLLLTILTSVAAFAAAQQAPTLPDGEGKTILNAACVNCLGLDVLQGREATKDEWTSILDRMKSYGTTMDAKQSETLLTYLVTHFGPRNNEEAMKKLLDTSCGGCHGLDLISARQATQDEWKEIVERMIARGASIPEKDITPLVQYLAKAYGPK